MTAKPIMPSFIQTGIALYSGLVGVLGTSFEGIVFGGTIKTGGLLGGAIGIGGGVLGDSKTASLEMGEIGLGGVGGTGFSSFLTGTPPSFSKSPFIVLMMMSSSGFSVGSAI